jgi:Zn-dependent protease with chaperone function
MSMDVDVDVDLDVNVDDRHAGPCWSSTLLVHVHVHVRPTAVTLIEQMQRMGRWLFRLWLIALAGLLIFWAAASAAFERLMGWSHRPLRRRIGDRLIRPDAVVLPALISSFDDDFRTPKEHDGPGWTEQQLPKLWFTCRSLAQKMGVDPPDAIHLSVEPGDCFAWVSRTSAESTRRHIALSLLDLRLLTHDEARAVIAHEIAHLGLQHIEQDFAVRKHVRLMDAVVEGLPFPLSLPVYLSRMIHDAGLRLGAHDQEREADLKAAQVVGGNHAAAALKRSCLQLPVLSRIFGLVLVRAELGQRAPLRLAEAAMAVYRSLELPKSHRKVEAWLDVAGEEHPAPSDRIASAEREASRTGVGAGNAFIDAFPELLVAEELLTKTYFPDTPTHTRSDASQLRRKALAARLKRL